jgi:N-acetylmuramic acid 6-phosphate etherase
MVEFDSPELDRLETEGRSPGAEDLDLRSTRDLVASMNRADAAAVAAVEAAATSIAATIDAVAARLAAGGRLVYAGAGSSGRLAAVDAAECVSTFGTEPRLVVALVAGGPGASPLEQEAAEDDAGAGGRDIRALELGPLDAVVGVSASGRTPYVLGAVSEAVRAGALTAAIVSVAGSELGRGVEHEIVVATGPEFLAGSTRLKAGTAQKLVLNAISTISMIRLGKTFGDLMVDVRATNDKLRARVSRLVRHATGADAEAADAALAAADGNAKIAIVSLLRRTSAEDARARLDAAGGSVRAALAEP